MTSTMSLKASNFNFDEVGDGIETNDNVPATMSDALDYDNPEQALRLLAQASSVEAHKQAALLLEDLKDFSLDLPKVLQYSSEQHASAMNHDDSYHHNHHSSSSPHSHPLRHATACADSIYGSLTKIASGGSEASAEIRKLEQEKEAMEEEGLCIATALALRQAEAQTNAAWSNRDVATASKTIQPWLQWKMQNEQKQAKGKGSSSSVDVTKLMHQKKRVVSYTGEYALDQLERIYQQLQQVLLQKYEQAVQQSNVQLIGNYTPLLGKLQLEPKAVQLYVQFLREILNRQLQEQQQGGSDKPPQQQAQEATFHTKMAKVYNVSVSTLRHHLPMVSHCLYKANGDVAVVQLVHEYCSEQVLPLWRDYQRQRQFPSVRRHAERISDLYHSGEVDPDADVGFTTHIGSLSDVDSAMEEAAMCIQHAESYLRFIQHTCSEVNRARQMRHEKSEYKKSVSMDSSSGDPPSFQALEILPRSTPLHEMVAEVGGQYVVIERCLLLASMHRAYTAESNMEDARYYRPLTLRSTSSSGAPSASNRKPLQSILVETCFYAARRGTQRAFATGHTGTASAMANFCVEALSNGFLEMLRNRAEDYGVAVLKPGDGLLVGGANYFATTAAIIGRQQSAVSGAAGAKASHEDTERRNQKISYACALLNDIQVAARHTEQLMITLNDAIAKGFSQKTHETEQLLLCVKSFSQVQDQFRMAAETSVESLESILKPRIRSIVGEAVGTENATSAGAFMSPVMGKQSAQSGGKGNAGAGGHSTRMNYDLDEEAYNYLQLSEGYMARLCSLLEELVQPLQQYLAPQLWDSLWVSIVGTTAKRLETLLRKSNFTALGALAFDADMRDFVSFTKDLLITDQFPSNAAVTKACTPLGRLSQMAKLLNVDEAEDVLDTISSLKRKGNWDWTLEDAQSFLTLRFPTEKVKDVLRLKDQEL